MSTRARIAAAVASAGVLAAAWNVGTATGHAIVPSTTTQGTTTDTTSGGTAASGSTSQGASSGSTSGSTSSGGSALADGTYTGTTATHRFGSVTVTVTVSGGRITALSENVVSDGDRKSDMINNRSVPTLRSRILAAGNADVSTISGATYTTRAYLTSLQSALDEAS